LGGERSGWSAATAIASLLAMVVFVIARLHGVSGAWYPYPTPSAPDVSALALAPAVVFAASGMLLPPAGD
jgi:hypothetical protein